MFLEPVCRGKIQKEFEGEDGVGSAYSGGCFKMFGPANLLLPLR